MMRQVDRGDGAGAAVAIVVLRSFVELHARDAGATVRVDGRGVKTRIEVQLAPWAVELKVEEGQLEAQLRNDSWAEADRDLLFRSPVPTDVERVGTWARRQAANIMQALQSTRDSTEERLAPLRILVVDDEPILRQALSRMLRDHAVDLADSTDRALELLAEREYDGVLLDVVMPGVGGIAFLDGLRRTRPDVARRVCMMTANPEMLSAHPAPSLIKPFSKGDLVDVLEWFQLTRRRD